MKHGTENKLKFKILKQMLKLPLYRAKGILQSIWDFTADNAMLGDIGRYSDAQIAMALEWEGSPQTLICALVEAGWLERSDAYRLIVHDWSENCEDWIRKRVKRAGLDFVKSDNAKIINLKPCAADNGGQRRTTADNGRPPNPIPIPIPNPKKKEPPGGGPPAREPRKASVMDMPKDPLEGRDDLASLFDEAVELLRSAHPRARIPLAGTKEWLAWRAELGALVEKDGFLAEDVRGCLRWLYLDEQPSEDGFSWRANCLSIPALRRAKRPDEPIKFVKVYEAWKRSMSANQPSRGSYDDQESWGRTRTREELERMPGTVEWEEARARRRQTQTVS